MLLEVSQVASSFFIAGVLLPFCEVKYLLGGLELHGGGRAVLGIS